MKRFDPNADCPKCGGDGFDPKYMPAVDLLRVECDICGYIANQFPLDRPDESASQGLPHGEGTTQEAPESGQAPQPAGSGAPDAIHVRGSGLPNANADDLLVNDRRVPRG